MNSQMIKLYSNVIDDFIVSLQKQYKNKNILSIDQITNIKKSLKNKIKDPSPYNKKIIDRFFQKTCGYIQHLSVYKDKKKQTQQQKKIQKLNQQHIPNRYKTIQQDQDDDLNQFKKNQNSQFSKDQILKQKQDPIKNNPNQLFQFQSNDDDQRLSTQQLNSIKQKTGIHILGSYNTKQKKFNSKKQQTKLTVYNAFVKINGHDQQLLFPVVQIVANRISKSQLHL